MILQNKQTGVLGVLEATTYHGGRPDNIIEVYEMGMGAVRVLAQYKTLEELLGEWEDYKPTEPLIKDEKIRKAVRAWADAQGLTEVYCASNGYEIYGGVDDWVMQFEGEPFPFADKNRLYTIAELCGEEEAPEPLEPTFVDLDERIKEKEEK